MYSVHMRSLSSSIWLLKCCPAVAALVPDFLVPALGSPLSLVVHGPSLRPHVRHPSYLGSWFSHRLEALRESRRAKSPVIVTVALRPAASSDLPSSQCLPLNPGLQSQLWVLAPGTQVPPF